jgi:prolycopene isomerase
LSDPGWYPTGGIQALPNILAKTIADNKGDVILSTKVISILTRDSKAIGVVLDNGAKVMAKKVVSNVDASQTYNNLLKINTRQRKYVDKIKISPSFFSVYLGLKDEFKKRIDGPATIWAFSTYDISNSYTNLDKILNPSEKIKYLLCVFPFMHDMNSHIKPTMEILIPAPFKPPKIWNKYRDYLMDKLIKKTEEIVPSLTGYINLKINATPNTFCNYTLNKNGSAYGWAATPYIIQKSLFPTQTSIQNLFLAGHWATGGLSQGGVPQVSAVGRKAARLIMEEVGLRWKHEISVIL